MYVVGTRIKLANKRTTGFKRIQRENKGGITQILKLAGTNPNCEAASKRVWDDTEKKKKKKKKKTYN